MKGGGVSSRRLRYGLLAAMAIALLAVIAAYAVYRRGLDSGSDLVQSLPSGPSLTIENLRHTAVKEGRVEWKLQARTARMNPERTRADLEGVVVEYYLENDEPVRMTADAGSLHTGTNDLRVSGNVVIVKEPYRMVTEQLHYRNQERILSADAPVEVTGKGLHIDADAATFDLETRKLRFEGNVHGTIEDIKNL